MKTNYYSKIEEIMKIAFSQDDMIDQESLFELQEKIAILTLKIAEDEKKEKSLIKAFPYLFKEVIK